MTGRSFSLVAACAALLFCATTGCKSQADGNGVAAGSAPTSSSAAPAQTVSAIPANTLSAAGALKAAQAQPGPQPADDAPPATATGGFDGHRALEQVAKQLSFGPRPAGSPALKQLQAYLKAELTSYGCKFDVDDFRVDTPAGNKSMENILVKIPGEKPGIILLGTHYDTKILENFVGADDAGSSTAVMLELARNLCPQKGRYQVWIAFFDGEEATKFEWSDDDSVYGSREMTAKLANSGDLPKVKAFLLADLVGGKKAHFERDGASTPALVAEVWREAAKLGYANVFVDTPTSIGGDDHFPFMKRKVPSVDVIDLNIADDVPYWHTANDTLDKISAKSLAITGHVFLETVKDMQSK
ncbi:MAG: M28 family peptidase [Candidatus Acidiferrum sp.]